MAVHLLATTRLTEAVRQLILSQHFPRHNQHLTEQEYGGLLAVPPIWPASPVFSPYAVTHGGYSQVRIDGIKYVDHFRGSSWRVARRPRRQPHRVPRGQDGLEHQSPTSGARDERSEPGS
ncbi:hypothetical protein N7474_006143 [Penicillium riverlandense]|uniref:uncharacterized protein n=1 Tax=Penicillium riverlandense TaxID=1903569 RepID=UPI00254898CA|nr:uncharacterized protein N7474_006143 [Penicillium riverlandense]KAJ5820552.1 hypothetical protein N7474_006143 [Penicillium riverlandense]